MRRGEERVCDSGGGLLPQRACQQVRWMFAAAQVELDHAPAAGAVIDLFLLQGPVFTGETGRFGPDWFYL